MAEVMKKVECDSPCNFSVKSRSEKEIIEIVKEHAKKMHNMTITDADVEKKITNA